MEKQREDEGQLGMDWLPPFQKPSTVCLEGRNKALDWYEKSIAMRPAGSPARQEVEVPVGLEGGSSSCSNGTVCRQFRGA